SRRRHTRWPRDWSSGVCSSDLTLDPEAVHDGRWVTQAVANAATDFFKSTADLMPGKPFIYSSREGDLVAEFETKRGTMTSIISRSEERRVGKECELRERVK